MIEKIKECKSLSEVGRCFGYDYYNGRVKIIIIKKCKELGIDIEKQIEEYKNRKVYCKNCGKEITGKNRFRKIFCSSSCAASYNNKQRGPLSNEQKNKIRETLLKKQKENKKK